MLVPHDREENVDDEQDVGFVCWSQGWLSVVANKRVINWDSYIYINIQLQS